MKKNLIVTAAAAIALFGFSALAQTPSNDNKAECCKEKTECKADCKDCKNVDCTNPDCKKADKKGPKKLEGNRKMERGPRPDLFEGITLSDEQKSKIEALHPKKSESNERNPEKAREQHQEMLKAFKEILTPEQYAKFEENMSKSRFGKGKMPRRGHEGRGPGRPAPMPDSEN